MSSQRSDIQIEIENEIEIEMHMPSADTQKRSVPGKVQGILGSDLFVSCRSVECVALRFGWFACKSICVCGVDVLAELCY